MVASLSGRSSPGAMFAGRIGLLRVSLVWCQIVTSSGLASGPYFNTIVACDSQTGQIMARIPMLSEGSDVPSSRRMEWTSIWTGESVDRQDPQRIIPPSVANASPSNPASEYALSTSTRDGSERSVGSTWFSRCRVVASSVLGLSKRGLSMLEILPRGGVGAAETGGYPGNT